MEIGNLEAYFLQCNASLKAKFPILCKFGRHNDSLRLLQPLKCLKSSDKIQGQLDASRLQHSAKFSYDLVMVSESFTLLSAVHPSKYDLYHCQESGIIILSRDEQ